MTTEQPRDTRAAVRLHGLRTSFGEVTAVDGIDLTVAAGEVVALLGPNGAGRTATIAMGKAGARTRAEAVLIAEQHGWLSRLRYVAASRQHHQAKIVCDLVHRHAVRCTGVSGTQVANEHRFGRGRYAQRARMAECPAPAAGRRCGRGSAARGAGAGVRRRRLGRSSLAAGRHDH
ncbi:MAG TPA: ATP-binding cassette domain-containing protein [Actinomycetes bacterium]|nr:ATP-binding cassette domain-containing protein [Actinomycetes bacterium]